MAGATKPLPARIEHRANGVRTTLETEDSEMVDAIRWLAVELMLLTGDPRQEAIDRIKEMVPGSQERPKGEAQWRELSWT